MYAGKLSLFKTPFNANRESVPHNLQMEVIETQCNDLSKSIFDANDTSLIDFCKNYVLSCGKFPNFVEHVKKMASLFGSTYVCGQLSSRMKCIKNHLRTILTDAHLDSIVLLASRNLSPSVEIFILQ